MSHGHGQDDIIHRHLARVEVAEQLLDFMMKPGRPNIYYRVSSGVIADAQFAGVVRNVVTGVCMFLWEHPSFPPVYGLGTEYVVPVLLEQRVFGK